MSVTFTIAPHFHLAAPWAERILVADGPGWRVPTDDELKTLVRQPTTHEELAACVCLFALPAHLRSAFWAMLERQAAEGDGDFVAFAAEAARFLAFKQLAPPEGAAFELVVHANGLFDGTGVWGVVNLGDSTSIEVEAVRVRLGPGEGCRLPNSVPLALVSGAGEEPDVLVVVRWASTSG